MSNVAIISDGTSQVATADLIDLAAMWEETSRLHDKGGDRMAAITYRDCASDLRMLLGGNKSVIERLAP